VVAFDLVEKGTGTPNIFAYRDAFTQVHRFAFSIAHLGITSLSMAEAFNKSCEFKNTQFTATELIPALERSFNYFNMATTNGLNNAVSFAHNITST